MAEPMSDERLAELRGKLATWQQTGMGSGFVLGLAEALDEIDRLTELLQWFYDAEEFLGEKARLRAAMERYLSEPAQ